MADRKAKPVAEAAARATKAAKQSRRGGTLPAGAGLRSRDILPLLVLHLIEREPAYGNRLIEEIAAITKGVISVNPNTMYPLLRELESDGLITGQWEHPEKRTRRFYEISESGSRELARLREELEPFLDSVVRSFTLIRDEIYGG